MSNWELLGLTVTVVVPSPVTRQLEGEILWMLDPVWIVIYPGVESLGA